jgi:FAD/FMN-containing dehydrogenase
MNLVTLAGISPFQRELAACIEGEVRFDAVSQALYSTDASVYQIRPLGVVVAKTREDVVRVRRRRVSPSVRGSWWTRRSTLTGYLKSM